MAAPTEPAAAPAGEGPNRRALPGAWAAVRPSVRVLPAGALPAGQSLEKPKVSGPELPVNRTHISTTDPEAELARNKSGVTELSYKEHRMVDDGHGVITAVVASSSHIADGRQLAGLYEQPRATTGLQLGQVTLAGDHPYGTASNYI